MRYLAFVSYAHRDSRHAHWLHRAIETYRLPRRLSRERGLARRPGRLFLDRSELPSSPDLSAAIQAALGDAANLLLVCSPAAAASRWVNEEVRRFRDLRGRERIFCLIVDGDPALRDGPGGCFPPALLEPDPGDVHPVEPLAADLRPGQDRRGDARLKLLAGLLGVEFDALRQRDQARRLRRLTVAAAVLTVIAAALLALSVAAVLSRNEARRQAETATRTTEFLRKLFASVNPGETRGREPTVRALVDRGVAEIATAPELRDQPLVRADLMTTLAEMYAILGRYRSADALVGQAARVDRSDPGIVMRQDKIRAEIAQADGRSAAALALIDHALAVAGPARSPTRSLMLIDRGLIAQGLGDDAVADRSLAQARSESLSLHPPDLDGADRALREIARRDWQQGRYDRAQRELAALARSRQRLGAGDDPLLGVAYNELGAIRYRLGDDAGARRWFEQALAIEARLLGDAHPTVATIRGNIARIMVEQRRFAPALRMLAQTRGAVVAEQGAHSSLLAWQDDSIGLALMGSGDRAGAEAAFRRGLGIAHATHAAKEADLLVDLADLLCDGARAGEAPPLLDRAARGYAAAAATPAWTLARAEAVRGRCLMRAGDRAAGAALVRRAAPAVIGRWGADSLFGGRAALALAEADRGARRAR